MKPLPQNFEQTTAFQPPKRWFRLKFADGAIDGTDWHSEQKAEDCRQWYLENMPHIEKYKTATIIELTPEQKRDLHIKAVVGVIGHQNAAIFLGGRR